MSFVMKYNAEQEEVENLSTSTSTDGSPKCKKVDRSGSILDKYFKSFKSDKNPAEEVADSKSCECSPAKEHFGRSNKRSEGVDADGDGDKWKLFADIKYKLTQAVEDIKSSRNNEESRERIGNVDGLNVTDSEENSLHQEPDQNSFTSTDNQVPSLTNSTQNLSELSPPIISHSGTMTDIDVEITSSSEINQDSTESTEGKYDNEPSCSPNVKRIRYENSDDDEQLEIESGVDALEDVELLMPKDSASSSELTDYVNADNNLGERTTERTAVCDLSIKSDPPRVHVATLKMIILSVMTLASFVIFPSMILLNGFFLGLWFSNFIHRCYLKIWNILESDSAPKKSLVFSNVHHRTIPNIVNIVEFEPLRKYQGWINIYTKGKYDPLTYHISMTQTVFMKLEGSSLRISFTHNKIPKRALWDEKPYKVPFHQHRIYDLEGAKIKLLPVGIVKKRHWSKKYPICIILKDSSKINIFSAKSRSIDDNECPLESPSPSRSKDTSLERISKSEYSLSDLDIKLKNSPKKTLPVSDEKLSKSLPLESATPNLDNGDKKSSKNKSSSKSFSIKAIKEQLYPKNVDAVPEEDTKDSTNTLIVNDCIDNSNSLSCETQISDTCSVEDFKEVSQHSEDDEKQNQYDKNIFSDEWSKEDFDEADCDLTVLYLFGRTGRDKDEWFRRLKAAIDDANREREVVSQADALPLNDNDDKRTDTNQDLHDNSQGEIKQDSSSKNSPVSKVKFGSLASPKKTLNKSDNNQSVLWTSGDNLDESPLVTSFYTQRRESFWKYMKNVVEENEANENKNDKTSCMETAWLNAIMNRIIFDTFQNTQWISMIQDRIQKKLKTLKLPPFMSPLLITALEFGPESPQIQGVSAPILNSKGVWVDLYISYDGRATMTLMTQLNLMYFKEKKDNQGEDSVIQKESIKIHKDALPVYDSDLDDTAESSSEDETVLTQTATLKQPIAESDPATLTSPSTSSSAKKILRFVDKIAASKYFQHVSEYKYVKRALEEVSNTDLKLSVELYGLVGCLAINIPPPPSDRIWIGFRDNPQLLIKAKPEVGSRVINFAHVTSWIEKKLCSEFEKVLVLPNMEDFQLDFMISPTID